MVTLGEGDMAKTLMPVFSKGPNWFLRSSISRGKRVKKIATSGLPSS